MPTRIRQLSASEVDRAKPRSTSYVLRDGYGLCLKITPSGGKLWHFDYRRPTSAKRNTISFGPYPAVSLKLARARREDARAQLADGIDPAEKRRADLAAKGGADSFEAVAREWYAVKKAGWSSAHGERILRRLELHAFPWIGARAIRSIGAPEVLELVRRVEAAGHGETAHRTLSNIGQVMRYAIATSRAATDPTNRMAEALAPTMERHFAAIIDPQQLSYLLRDIDAYTGTLPVRAALRLAPLVFLRPSEMRMAEWSEFDLVGAVWNVPPSRRKLTKVRKHDPQTQPHLVPLSQQAVAILQELWPLTGAGRFVFPGARSPHRPISDMALLGALRRMGYDKHTMTTHGWRATARTLLAETLHYPMHIIEHQLDHRVIDPNGRAYNRTSYIEERREMMQCWADYLDARRNDYHHIDRDRNDGTTVGA